MATAVPGASTPDIDGLWDGLWKAAVDQYRRSLGVDLGDQGDTVVNELQCCSTAEEILDVLQGSSERLRDRRHGSNSSQVIREALRPVVQGLAGILDVGGETASSLVRS